MPKYEKPGGNPAFLTRKHDEMSRAIGFPPQGGFKHIAWASSRILSEFSIDISFPTQGQETMAYCTDEEAVEIWKERWRGDFVHVIATKRGLNMFRVYEVFEEKMNVGSRLKAIEEFSSENPELAASTDFSPHKAKRRVVRLPDNDQMDMFGALKTAR